MKKYLILTFSLLCSLSIVAQVLPSVKYFRHLAYNHVSPHAAIKGIYEISGREAAETSHYAFKYDNQGRIVEILNNHYHTERKHPLASIGAYKTLINYSENVEVRVFYDPNGKRISNDREVFKEVFKMDQKGFRNELTFYNEDDEPMESNWGIAKYQWSRKKKMVIERRFSLQGEQVNVSPYFDFGVTGILYTTSGFPKAYYNLDENLKPVANQDGVVSYQDTYDEKGNHIKYSYRGVKDELVRNQWGFATAVKGYDENGNQMSLSQYDENGELLSERPTLTNVKIVAAKPVSAADTAEIKEMSLGYLVALQQLKPELMKRVMHEKLAKRTVGYDRETKSEQPQETTYDEMIAFAASWNKSGTKFPFNPSNEVVILDIYQRMATVKLISDNWVEYLHLIKLNGKWKIINLLWQHKDASRYRD